MTDPDTDTSDDTPPPQRAVITNPIGLRGSDPRDPHTA